MGSLVCSQISTALCIGPYQSHILDVLMKFSHFLGIWTNLRQIRVAFVPNDRRLGESVASGSLKKSQTWDWTQSPVNVGELRLCLHRTATARMRSTGHLGVSQLSRTSCRLSGPPAHFLRGLTAWVSGVIGSQRSCTTAGPQTHASPLFETRTP